MHFNWDRAPDSTRPPRRVPWLDCDFHAGLPAEVGRLLYSYRRSTPHSEAQYDSIAGLAVNAAVSRDILHFCARVVVLGA